MDREKFRKSSDAVMQFAKRYHADAAVRARVARGDISDLELELPPGLEVKIMEQSEDTCYIPLPPPLSAATLSDEVLELVSGGTDYAPDMSHLGSPGSNWEMTLVALPSFRLG